MDISMAHTQSITRRIKDRSSTVNTDINSRIKYLQRLLVSYSFNNEATSSQYFKTLEKIKKLRSQIFKGTTA
jgi:hypothetical protein